MGDPKRMGIGQDSLLQIEDGVQAISSQQMLVPSSNDTTTDSNKSHRDSENVLPIQPFGCVGHSLPQSTGIQGNLRAYEGTGSPQDDHETFHSLPQPHNSPSSCHKGGSPTRFDTGRELAEARKNGKWVEFRDSPLPSPTILADDHHQNIGGIGSKDSSSGRSTFSQNHHQMAPILQENALSIIIPEESRNTEENEAEHQSHTEYTKLFESNADSTILSISSNEDSSTLTRSLYEPDERYIRETTTLSHGSGSDTKPEKHPRKFVSAVKRIQTFMSRKSSKVRQVHPDLQTLRCSSPVSISSGAREAMGDQTGFAEPSSETNSREDSAVTKGHRVSGGSLPRGTCPQHGSFGANNIEFNRYDYKRGKLQHRAATPGSIRRELIRTNGRSGEMSPELYEDVIHHSNERCGTTTSRNADRSQSSTTSSRSHAQHSETGRDKPDAYQGDVSRSHTSSSFGLTGRGSAESGELDRDSAGVGQGGSFSETRRRDNPISALYTDSTNGSWNANSLAYAIRSRVRMHPYQSAVSGIILEFAVLGQIIYVDYQQQTIPLDGLGNLFHHKDWRLAKYIQLVMRKFYKDKNMVRLEEVSFMCYIIFKEMQLPAPLWKGYLTPHFLNEEGKRYVTIRIAAQAPFKSFSINSSPRLNSKTSGSFGSQGGREVDEEDEEDEISSLNDIIDAKNFFFEPTKSQIYTKEKNGEKFVSARSNISLALMEVIARIEKSVENLQEIRDKQNKEAEQMESIAINLSNIIRNTLQGTEQDRFLVDDRCMKCGEFGHQAFSQETGFQCPLRDKQLRKICTKCGTGGHEWSDCQSIEA